MAASVALSAHTCAEAVSTQFSLTESPCSDNHVRTSKQEGLDILQSYISALLNVRLPNSAAFAVHLGPFNL